MARPPKYDPKLAEQARYICATFGATDAQLAQALGVSERAIYDWKQEHPEFLQAVEEAKAAYDTRNVESSVLACAQGYHYQEELYDKEAGQIVRLWKFRHPDVKAQALWLWNRRRWQLPPVGGVPAALPDRVGNELPPGVEEERPDTTDSGRLAELAQELLSERHGTRIRVPAREVKPEDD